MNTHGIYSPKIRSSSIAGLFVLASAGAGGMTLGGRLWGLLGAGMVLCCVGWICKIIEYRQNVREIERYYAPPVPPPRPAVCLRPARTLVKRPLRELEPVS